MDTGVLSPIYPLGSTAKPQKAAFYPYSLLFGHDHLVLLGIY